MSRDRRGLLLAGLIGLGAFGGATGRLALRRLRRLVGFGSLALLVLGSLSLLLAGLAGGDEAVRVTAALAVALIGLAWLLFLFWCLVAFAAWITRPEPDA